ncbi:MAG TPA: N-6 DNA methylase, partial [Planctomycetota bacterium]|nr:N-6 DNA methylase [Planctomycetota bacterium]
MQVNFPVGAKHGLPLEFVSAKLIRELHQPDGVQPMARTITEFEFTADVASWINAILQQNPSLPFSEAKCEQRADGSETRRDLTLLDNHRRIVLTGEVKLPFQTDGGSPYNASVLKDARSKALRADTKFFFTWNVNVFVLWQTAPARVHWRDTNWKLWDVTNVHLPEHMDQPMTIHAIKLWLEGFLREFAQIHLGSISLGRKSPDETFVESLESALRMPILLSLEELARQYSQKTLKSKIDEWMRSEQGWIIYDDAEGIRENLDNAAKFACYALVNKIVFHEALLKRYHAKMDKLSVPEHIDTGEALRHHLEGYFSKAKAATDDYETVFGEDHKSVGNRIPFYSNAAVQHWRQLIEQIHDFDFSKLDYEIIGSIFERLISPESRKKYGQFYTRVEVVDLMNSFCIRSGFEKVMDPACGGGTFLVRAYARKREIAPGRKHGELLSDMFGIDISRFAAHLATINLATRDLIDAENYPRILRNDFFELAPHKRFLSLPVRNQANPLGAKQHREVQIPPLDAVIGNPPYVRQEDIPKAKTAGQHGTKEYYQKLARDEGADFSGRSDIHCYFWPHAASFLKPDGWLCLLTSSQWLDVEYGFRLQEWLLRNFRIVAVLESIDEPWFVGARVATTATILQREQDESARMSNMVRFVQLRRPLRELLAHDGTSAGAVTAADQLRDELLSLTTGTINDRFRARIVRQGDLWEEGVRLGQALNRPGQEAYYGGKWGVHLRAPDLWFELLERFGKSFAPLCDVAEVKRGITSGKDSFFFPKDCTDEQLQVSTDPMEFEMAHGVPRKDVASGKVRLVLCGEERGEIKPIEAEYLEPEVHSLMEIDGFVVSPQSCSRKVVLMGGKREKLGRYARQYVQWGETNNFQNNETCLGRHTNNREWYDLTGHKPSPLIWPKQRQYRYIAPSNPECLLINCGLYGISPREEATRGDLWVAILNSTWTLLSCLQFGRPVGNEGTWSTMISDVNMMLVPDLRKASEARIGRLEKCARKLKSRKASGFLSERRLRTMAYRQAGKADQLDNLSDQCELDMRDRRELDDAVLQMMGVR